jgi:hypothetical protein
LSAGVVGRRPQGDGRVAVGVELRQRVVDRGQQRLAGRRLGPHLDLPVGLGGRGAELGRQLGLDRGRDDLGSRVGRPGRRRPFLRPDGRVRGGDGSPHAGTHLQRPRQLHPVQLHPVSLVKVAGGS